MSAPSRISPVISALLLSLALSAPLVAPARVVALEEAQEAPAEAAASQETLHEEVAQLAERVRASLEHEDATETETASADDTPADPRASTTALYEQLAAAATDPDAEGVVTDDEAALLLLTTGADTPKRRGTSLPAGCRRTRSHVRDRRQPERVVDVESRPCR